jgi:glutathione synthase/RimK-type ligase-like ATP-grasp enzyme
MALVIAGRVTPTNVALLSAARALDMDAALLPVEEALRRSLPGDTVLARLDVRRSLDGVEPGFEQLDRLLERGVRLVNPPGSLLAAHDKLQTAIRLAEGGVPHPRTAHVDDQSPAPDLEFPVVVKPRFGSWGRDVVLCEDARDLRRSLSKLRRRQ